MAAGSIVVDLLMRTGSFETDTKRAEKRLQELKKEAVAVGQAIGLAFSAVGVAAAYMVKSSIDNMDAMSKLAQQVGSTVEEFSALSYAADLSGVSQEQLSGAMVKLTKNMSDAAMGTGEAEKGFKALGITLKNADGTMKSSSQVLSEVATKFAGFRDGAEKTAIAVSLFGRSGAQLIPLLNSGAAGLQDMTEEARALGVVLDSDVSKAAEEFNDNLSRMQKAIEGISNRAATDLLPTLVDVSSALVDLAKNQAFVETTSDIVKGAIGALVTVFQTLAVVGSDVGFVFLSVGREIGAWAAQIGALASGDLQGFRAISDAVKEDGERARAELDKFQARIMAIGQPVYRDPRILGDPGSIASQTAGWGRPAAPQITDERSTPKGKASKSASLGIAAEFDALDAFRRSELEATEAVNRALESSKWAAWEEERTEKLKASAAAQDRLNALIAATPTGELEKQRETMTFLADQFQRGAFGAMESAEAIAKYGEAANAALGNLPKLLEENDEFAKRMRENVQDSLGDGLYQAMNGNFKDIESGFTSMLQRMVAEALAEDLMGAMFGGKKGDSEGMLGGMLGKFTDFLGLGKKAGGGSSGIGSLFGSLGDLFGGFFADGGTPPLGKVSIVGEDGPEAFVPRTAGTILPADQTAQLRAGGGRSINVVQNFAFSGPVDQRTQQQVATQAGLGIQRALARNA